MTIASVLQSAWQPSHRALPQSVPCMTFECIHLPVTIPGSSAKPYSKMSYNTWGTDLGFVLRQIGNAYQACSKGCYVLGSALQHESESGILLGEKVHKAIAGDWTFNCRVISSQAPAHILHGNVKLYATGCVSGLSRQDVSSRRPVETAGCRNHSRDVIHARGAVASDRKSERNTER